MDKDDLRDNYSRTKPSAAHAGNGEPDESSSPYASLPKRNLAAIIAVIAACLVLAGGGIGLGVWALLSSERSQETKKEPTAPPAPVAEVPPDTGNGQPVAPKPQEPQPAAPKAQVMKPREPRVQSAIDKGVAYLRKHSPARRKNTVYGDDAGKIALAGLAMLECGVSASDPDITEMADVLRRSIPRMNKTYEVAPAILFLDRLHKGDPSIDKPDHPDRLLIKTLGMRLVAGQTNRGIWGYHVPILKPKEEEKIVSQLRGNFGKSDLATTERDGDMSNTQFAALAMWVARKYDVPVQAALSKAADTARKTQDPKSGTWRYKLRTESHFDSSTCAGLILLSLGKGVSEEKDASDFREDPAVKKGIVHLAGVIKQDIDAHGGKVPKEGPPIGANAWGDFYFLWALERTALILRLDKFGKHDWHSWGSEVLLQTQKKDGSWADIHPGVPDTSFALLFLVRANLFQDLSDKIKPELSDLRESLFDLALAKNE